MKICKNKEVVRQKNRTIDYLKEARLKKRLSQSELAKRLGTKQPATHGWKQATSVR